MAGQVTTAAVERNKQAAHRFYDEAWNQGRLEVIDEVVAPGFVDHDPQNPFPDRRGPEAARSLISMYRGAFPDLHMTIEAEIAEGDYVVSRWRANGTHKGELMGMAPTHRPGEVTGISIDRFSDGKITESWTNWDTLGLMQQIGAAPARGSIGEKVGVQVQRLMAKRMRPKT